jgi:hypothetical protein
MGLKHVNGYAQSVMSTFFANFRIKHKGTQNVL